MVRKFGKRRLWESTGTELDCVPYLAYVPDISPFSWASGSKDKFVLVVIAACAILYMAGTTLNKRGKKQWGFPLYSLNYRVLCVVPLPRKFSLGIEVPVHCYAVQRCRWKHPLGADLGEEEREED